MVAFPYNPVAFRGLSVVTISKCRSNAQVGHTLSTDFFCPPSVTVQRVPPPVRSYEERFRYGMFQKYRGIEVVFQYDFAYGLKNGLIVYDKRECTYVQLCASFLRKVGQDLLAHAIKRSRFCQKRVKPKFIFPGFANCSWLVEDDDQAEHSEPVDDESECVHTPRRRRTTVCDDDWFSPTGVTIQAESKRSPRPYFRRFWSHLVERIRYKIRLFRHRECSPLLEIATFQMDAHGDVRQEQEVAGNVAIVNQHGDSGEVASDRSYSHQELCSADIIASHDAFVDRWYKYKTYTWTKDIAQDTELFSILAPFDLVTQPNNLGDVPNTVPFNVHRYWSGDIDFRIVLNSNKFQMGQLQIAWWYEPDLDDKFSIRNNIWNASHNTHILVDAGASNEGRITVPYKHHLPLITTKKRSDYDHVLDMGRLICRIINPLSVSSAGPSACDITVYWKLSNCKFTGQILGSVDTPKFQMDTLLKVATGALNSLSSNNMDNPPDNRPPAYLVPTASHSWSAGTNISEPLHSLRLDPNGQAVHQPCVDEMTVDYVKSKFGFVKTIEWSKDHGEGHTLLDCDAAPIMDISEYKKWETTNELTSYSLPPVAVLTSLFNYWRGDLEYRFDIIATQFHTGALIVGYVPGATNTTTVSLETVLSGPHMVFSLEDGRQFTYTVPYIADRPFWGRKYLGNYNSDTVYSPSRLYLFVLNKMVVMESIVDKIYLNLYVRGSPSFEVSVPVQPCLGCGFNKTVLYKTSELLFAVQGYAPYYAGYSNAVTVTVGEKSVNIYVLRYGQASHQISIFDKRYLLSTTTKYYYLIRDVNAAPIIYTGSQSYRATYGVLVWYSDVVGGTAIMCICQSEEKAKAAASAYDGKIQTIASYLWVDDYSTASNTYSHSDPGWIVKKSTTLLSNTLDDFAFPQGERDNNELPVIPTHLLPSSNYGSAFYSESFSSLKDVARRYNYYANLLISKQDSSLYGQCNYIVPVLPQGMDLQLGTVSFINEIENRCRDGVVPLIASGYRYYRGSMRFRLVSPTDFNAVAWVQHRPDRKLRSRLPLKCTSVSTAEGIYNFGYATYIQDLGVNSIVEFEVPFYQNSSFGLLQRPKILTTNESFYYSLGELSLGFSITPREKQLIKDFSVGLFSSIGDDMTFSTFQGFPPMVVLDQISSGESASFQGAVQSSIKNEAIGAIKEEVRVVSQELQETLEDKLSPILELDNRLSILKSSIFHIFHMVANANWKSFAIGIAAILCDIGILTLTCARKFAEAVLAFFEKLKLYAESGNQSNPPDISCEQATMQGSSFDDPVYGAASGIIVLLWSAVSALLKIKSVKPAATDQWAKLLTKDIKDVLTSSNALFTFLRNIFSVLDNMKDHCLGYVCPSYLMLRNFTNEYVEYKAWATDILELRDPVYFNEHKFKQSYKLRVNYAYERAKYFLRNAAEIQNSAVTRSIQTLYNYIHEVRDKLIELGSDGFVRKEPFTMWIYGNAGIGKSTIADHLCMELLKHRNITSSVPPIYNHDCQSDYWDACNNNPVMRIDDMFNVQEGEILTKQLATLFAVVSPVVLCPVKARIEDKGLPYNPEIFCITSNYDFVRFNNINEDAVHRRRDVLVKCTLAPLSTPPRVVDGEECPHCLGESVARTPKKFLTDYHHLRFQFSSNVLIPNNYDTALEYSIFLQDLKSKFDRVAVKNEDMYRGRLEEMVNYIDTSNMGEGYESFLDVFQAEAARRYDEHVMRTLYSLLQRGFIKTKELQNKIYSYWQRMFVRPVTVPEYTVDDRIICPEELEAMFNRASFEIDDAWQETYASYNYNSAISLTASHYSFGLPGYDEIATVVGDSWLINPRENNCSKEILEAFVVSILNNGAILSFPALCRWIAEFDHVDTSQPAYRLLSCFRRYATKLSESDAPECMPRDISGHKRPVELCSHWRYRYDKMFYNSDNGHLMVENFIISQHCYQDLASGTQRDRGRMHWCLWHDYGFQHLVYCTFLHYNSIYKWRLSTKSSFVASTLPAVFRASEDTLCTSAEWIAVCKDATTILWNGLKKVYEKFCDFCTFIGKYIDIIAIAGAILMPLVACGLSIHQQMTRPRYGLYCNTWSVPQSNPYGSFKPSTFINENVPIASSAQGSIPQFDVAIDRIKSNMFTVTALIGEKFVACTGIVLRNRELLLLRHFMEELHACPDAVYYGKYTNRPCNTLYGTVFSLFDCKVSSYEYRDSAGVLNTNYVLLYLPLKFQESKDLVKFIATSKDHECVNGDGCLINVKDNSVYTNLRVYRERGRPVVINGEGKYSTVKLQDLYSYRMQGKGMCGSVLLCRNLERPIIGMHVAGVETGNVRGLAEPLVFETFSDLPMREVTSYTEPVIPHLTDSEFKKINIETEIYPVGCVEPKYTAHQGSVSAYIPSAIQGVFPVRTEPNPLSPSDSRIAPHSPLALGCGHMGKPPLDFPAELLVEARVDLQNKLLQVVKPCRSEVGIVSLQDAICGNVQISGFEPLEWSTSPGFPLRFEKDKQRTASGKKWLFDLEETPKGYVLKGLHPKLEKLLAVEQAMRDRGIKPFTVFVDCLKDTCLPLDKCRVPGKTRIFSISPVQFTIVFKQYFLDFMASYQNARFSAEHGIGIDCDGSEWTDLAGYLTEKGQAIVCGDYKNFGPGLMLSAAEQAFEIIFLWYKFHGDETNNKIRRILAAEILGAYHLCCNLVYTCPSGIPSGSPITTPLNSLVNSIYLRCCWKFTTNLSFRDMHAYCNIITYGDDVCINVSDCVKDKFNTQTMHDAFMQYNIVFTDIDKSNDMIIPYRNILTATFLKRRFKQHPKRQGVWLAALDEVSIEGCANWVRKGQPVIDATLEVADQCSQLAYGHGPEYYDYVVERLQRSLYELDLERVLIFPSWSELDSIKHKECIYGCYN